MKNNHCPDCPNRTKLYLREGKKRYYICKIAKTCPHTKQEDKQ